MQMADGPTDSAVLIENSTLAMEALHRYTSSMSVVLKFVCLFVDLVVRKRM